MAMNGLQDPYSADAAAGPSNARGARAQDESAHGLVGRGKRVRSQTVDDEDELSDDDSRNASPALGPGELPTKPKRKRNRAALSCALCKKRKIKCDRKLPCEACIKRNEQHLCRWEQPKVEPAPQPFALAVDHEQLRRRVAVLETVLARLAPDLAGELADAAAAPVTLPLRPKASTNDGDEQQDSDAENVEDAALVLEELALHHKLTRVAPKTGKTARSASPRLASSSHALPVLPPILSGSGAMHLSPSSTISNADLASRALDSLVVPAIDSRRKLVLDDIYANLPQRKSVSDWMLRNYFERVDWAWHLHHKPTFLAEYDAFCLLRSEGRQAEIDPLWLACFAMTLCLSVNSLESPIESPLCSITAQDLDTLPWKFFECAQSALECGDWTGKPRFRTLQAIVLFAPFFLFAGNRAAAERHQTYIGAALRMAQSMGLHQLGSDPSTMPLLSEEDEINSGLPPGVNTLKREMALRMLTTLLFLDYTSLRIKTSLPPHLVTSALPGNYNDSDLSPDEVVPPRPAEEATDISLDLVKFRTALEQRKFKEMMDGDLPLTYEAILAIDGNYRAILDSLPVQLREDYIPPLGEPLTNLWRRNMAIQSVHSRILRVHRPFMAKGWTVEKYRRSTTTAISAARSILACQTSLNSAPLLKSGFQLLNVQIAIIVLFMSLWQDTAQTPREADDDLTAITATFPWFEKHVDSRVAEVRMIAKSSLSAFRLLKEAYEDKESRRRAAGDLWDQSQEEPYGRLLQRVGAIVSATSSSSTDTLFVSPAATTSQPRAGGAMSLDSLLAPQQAHHSLGAVESWAGFANGGGPNGGPVFASSAALGLSDAQPDLAVDFDLAMLEGPEFADPNFSWSTWTALGQFASLGTF
ncbi:hypothetical protein NBRC10512_003219 [Rhodotorula toruloides]|uniref:RHTO0S05e07646g1_1 n=2 Tax=Rhodotorula toruloides TaxID=5286 RepID=A0A061AT52_RHOTO|nr:Zn(2)-C6 fungal-type transcription factor [Rhodotorula toruloides NP11]EMS23812.1 Zn(2)-C6 fungal-type transcription factor [Rhodotorula toruloides NP11]CDR40824.1 RHTO0S05e07646g1_1 [Rhodotorula toruloides]